MFVQACRRGVGAEAFARFIPILVFGLFGGVVADQLPKRRAIIVTQAGQMCLAFALGLLARRHWAGAGVVLGLAVATKLLPALLAVTVPPRRAVRVGAAALAAVVLVYLPHVLVLGTGVTGFLGGYLGEESHQQFDLLKPVLPEIAVRPVGCVLLAVTAGAAPDNVRGNCSGSCSRRPARSVAFAFSPFISPSREADMP